MSGTSAGGRPRGSERGMVCCMNSLHCPRTPKALVSTPKLQLLPSSPRSSLFSRISVPNCVMTVQYDLSV